RARRRGTPGPPARAKMSRWLSAAARMPMTTSPGPGAGSGQSPYSSTSLPPCRRKKTAFMKTSNGTPCSELGVPSIGSLQIPERSELLQILAVARAAGSGLRHDPIAVRGDGRGLEGAGGEESRRRPAGEVARGGDTGAPEDRRRHVERTDRNLLGRRVCVEDEQSHPPS